MSEFSTMKLRLLGQSNALGGGTHYQEFLSALRGLNLPGVIIEALDPGALESLAVAAAQSRPDDISVWFWPDRNAKFFRGRKIVWGVFESTRLPPIYLSQLDRFDRVWVPSAWAQHVLIINGLDREKIDVVPEGVDPELFSPAERIADRGTRPFRFLTIGKYEERKSYPILLDAFSAEFGNRNDAELVIKADYFLNHDLKRQQLEVEVARRNLRNVSLVWGDWPRAKLRQAYHEADAFVLPTRAEGWGLPIIEALACGTPVLTTRYSGQSEYLAAIAGSFYEVGYTMTVIRDDEFLKYWPDVDALGGEWAEPDRRSLSNGLSEVFKNHPKWISDAQLASAVLRREFTWGQAAKKAISVLTEQGWLD